MILSFMAAIVPFLMVLHGDLAFFLVAVAFSVFWVFLVVLGVFVLEAMVFEMAAFLGILFSLHVFNGFAYCSLAAAECVDLVIQCAFSILKEDYALPIEVVFCCVIDLFVLLVVFGGFLQFFCKFDKCFA